MKKKLLSGILAALLTAQLAAVLLSTVACTGGGGDTETHPTTDPVVTLPETEAPTEAPTETPTEEATEPEPETEPPTEPIHDPTTWGDLMAGTKGEMIPLSNIPLSTWNSIVFRVTAPYSDRLLLKLKSYPAVKSVLSDLFAAQDPLTLTNKTAPENTIGRV